MIVHEGTETLYFVLDHHTSCRFLSTGVPESPVDLQTLEVTWESVQLEWQAGFDGGYEQEFLIRYREADVIEQVNVGGVTRYNVTHLYPQEQYTFQVFGRNELGSGGLSNPVAAQTEGTLS